MLPGRVINEEEIETELGVIEGKLPRAYELNRKVELLLRPDDVLHYDDSSLQLKIINKVFRGAEYLYTLSLPSGQPIIFMVQSHHNHDIGEYVGIKLDTDNLLLFPIK